LLLVLLLHHHQSIYGVCWSGQQLSTPIQVFPEREIPSLRFDVNKPE
jgi:hypothetical protein